MQIALGEQLANYKEQVFPIIQVLAARGATAYIVGGCVRDLLLGLPLKDLDIEVHGIALSDLHEVLNQFGHVEEVGKKFGVLLLLGLAVDWSLPRRDSSGRKPQVEIDPQLDIKHALIRRDLTMNAMAINLTEVVIEGKKGEIIDPFGGLEDIAAKQLRAVDDAFFVQDPLRLLRVMQFIARFEMQPTAALSELCRRMSLYDEYDDRLLARERIQGEVAKLLLQSSAPSHGFSWICSIGREAELFPFIASQDDKEIALALVDSTAERTCALSTTLRLELMLAALCWPYWSRTGGPLRRALAACTGSYEIIDKVPKLLAALKSLTSVSDNRAGIVLCKKAAAQLGKGLSVEAVAILAWSFYEPQVSAVENTLLYQLAQKAGVLHGPEDAAVLGRDLLNYVQPGPEMGRLIGAAYEIQLEEGIRDKEALLQRILKK